MQGAVDGGEKSWIADEQKALRSLGAKIREVDLSRLSTSEAASVIDDSEGIHVHGGNTFYLLQEMQRVGFKEMLPDPLYWNECH
jgi:dipeptidase E